ncbi:MAG TPA: hypothetical protein VGN86_08465 [Pyrinomonadaceae bacterium]|jgi:hypothetical protein|nr:hypothetical protein [Pyrinomonadaceae bacterium]
MTGVVKGILISVTVLIVVIAIMIGAGIYWLSSHGPALLEKGKQNVVEGQNFGKGTDNQGCLTEALARHRRDTSMSGALATQLFLTSCLPNSRETPEFCTEVPSRMEFVKSAQWQTERCLKENLRDSYCPQIFAQVQSFCEMKERRKSRDRESR